MEQLTGIHQMLGDVQEKLGYVSGRVEAILEQTRTTNGRVSHLEGREGACDPLLKLISTVERDTAQLHKLREQWEKSRAWVAGACFILGAIGAAIWQHIPSLLSAVAGK